MSAAQLSAKVAPSAGFRAPRGARRSLRAARIVSRAVAEDESSSSSAVYQPALATEDVSGDDVNAAAKKRLLAVAAASGRGLDATPAQKAAATSLIAELVTANPTPEPATSATIDGDWELVYSDTFLFRSSPFFWALGSMMGDTADFFYGAHSHQTGIFGGGVGRVVQSVDTKGGRLVSDCVVKASLGVPLLGFSPIFSGYGSVITAGRCAAKDGTRLAVTAETTTVRQDDANVLPQLNFLNGTTVPVEDVMKQVGGGESGPEVYLDTFYLDDEMRISKLEDGSVFVYQRC